MKNRQISIDMSSIIHEAAAPRPKSKRTNEVRYVYMDSTMVAFAGPPPVMA